MLIPESGPCYYWVWKLSKMLSQYNCERTFPNRRGHFQSHSLYYHWKISLHHTRFSFKVNLQSWFWYNTASRALAHSNYSAIICWMKDWNDQIKVVLDPLSQVTVTFIEDIRYKRDITDHREHQIQREGWTRVSLVTVNKHRLFSERKIKMSDIWAGVGIP